MVNESGPVARLPWYVVRWAYDTISGCFPTGSSRTFFPDQAPTCLKRGRSWCPRCAASFRRDAPPNIVYGPEPVWATWVCRHGDGRGHDFAPYRERDGVKKAIPVGLQSRWSMSRLLPKHLSRPDLDGQSNHGISSRCKCNMPTSIGVRDCCRPRCGSGSRGSGVQRGARHRRAPNGPAGYDRARRAIQAGGKIPFIFDPGQGPARCFGARGARRDFIDQGDVGCSQRLRMANGCNRRPGLTATQGRRQGRCADSSRGGLKGRPFYTQMERTVGRFPAGSPLELWSIPPGCGRCLPCWSNPRGLLGGLDWETTGRIASLMGFDEDRKSRGPQNHDFHEGRVRSALPGSFWLRIQNMSRSFSFTSESVLGRVIRNKVAESDLGPPCWMRS